MADMAVNYGGMMADKRSLPLCWLRPSALAGIEQSFFNYEELSLFFLESNDVTPIERF